ncbi:hypothetical protein HWV62_8997 [Athelia sp. TMB]|nr:hypothetical protein HWV62_8997 [Athelia sp. TMB]
MRVVSLPARFAFSPFPGSSPSSEASFPAAQRIDTPELDRSEPMSQFLLRRYADTPHTPSPPSSPESVLIIETENQLPRTFLRQNFHQSDDEGWITWADSPPRPIPALHGPLSLPYARCPSGAEGTIIEEPEHLPRMIWGLGPDDPPSAHSRTSSYNPHDSNSRSGIPKHARPAQPPRLRNQGTSANYLATPQQTPTFTPQLPFHSADTDDQAIILRRALEGLGTRPARDSYKKDTMMSNIKLQDHTCQATDSRDAFYHQMDTNVSPRRAFEQDTEIALDWELALIQQRRLKQSLLNQRHEIQSQAPGHLNRSAAVFVPSNLTPPQSYPRIFVEPRATKYYPAKNLTSTFATKHGLPTPPSSASPQWSADFSPYSNSLYSPEMIRSQQSKFPVPSSQQKPTAPSSSSYELPTFVHEHFGTAHSEHGLSSFKDCTMYSELPPKPARTVLATTLYPGPPPTSPLPPIPDWRLHGQPAAFDITPPLSPDLRRSISYQQPRSIPLSRLIERRLASVPEEEHNSFVQRSRILSSKRPFHHSVDSCISAHDHRQPLPLLSTERATCPPARAPVDTGLNSTTICGFDSMELFGVLHSPDMNDLPKSTKVKLPTKVDIAQRQPDNVKNVDDSGKENPLKARKLMGKKRLRLKKNKSAAHVQAAPQLRDHLESL